MKISNTTQLMFALKTKGIDIKEFDYIEDKTTEEYIGSHPSIVHGRRFYENPYLWTMVLDLKLDDIAEYLYNMKSIEGDLILVKAALNTQTESSLIPLKMVERYIAYTNSLTDEERIAKDIYIESSIDSILENLAATQRMNWFQKVVDLAISNHIEPRYTSFGNAGNGMALYYACTDAYLAKPHGDEFAYYLLKLGADPKLNDSLPFCMACKYAAYTLAIQMLDSGANMHTKNDVGLKMIQRNDHQRIKLDESNEISRKILLERYAADKKKEEPIEV